MVSSLSRVWQHVKLPDVSLGICPRYSLVVDEDIKKPTNKQTSSICGETDLDFPPNLITKY